METYSRLAGACGVIPNGETISPELHAFLTQVIEHGARTLLDAGHARASYALRDLASPEPFAEHFKTMLEHRRREPVWERLGPMPTGPTVIRLPQPIKYQRYFGPNDWAVPLSPEHYRISQEGEEWTVTFLPLHEVIYRGPGPVKIVSAPKDIMAQGTWTSDQAVD